MKKNRTRILLISAAVLVVLLVVSKKAGWIGGDDTTKVAVEKAAFRDVEQTVLANGKIVPELEVKISPEISGEITEVHVHVGDSVRKGQLLLRINPKIILATLDRARAAVNNARASQGQARARLGQSMASFRNVETIYKRNERLFKDGVISESEFQASKAQYEGAQEDLEAARQTVEGAGFSLNSAMASLRETEENLAKTDIYSPITGIVTNLNVEVGEKVVGTSQMAGTEMIRIANLSRMLAKVDVNENDIVNVKIGDTATVEVDAYPNKKFKGVVVEIANAATQTTTNLSDQVTNYPVKVLILRESYQDLLAKNPVPFRPGLSGTVEISTDRAVHQITVPIASVTVRTADEKGKLMSEAEAKRKELAKSEDKDVEASDIELDKEKLKEVVFIHKNGKLEARVVKTGIQDDSYLVILEGVKPGEEVVTLPVSAITKDLKNGQLVKVVDKSKIFEDKSDK